VCGVEKFTAIINPPQSSILAVGVSRREPIVEDDRSVHAAKVMRVAFSVDHCAADGEVVARWMARLIELIEKPLARPT
jgi:pyruvate dehydrogenase E2 component (dihydrolipoamide acetyltransferase)